MLSPSARGRELKPSQRRAYFTYVLKRVRVTGRCYLIRPGDCQRSFPAGGPDVHPHATSDPAAWLVWERDVASVNPALRRLEAFFRALLAGRRTDAGAHRNRSLPSAPSGA